MLMQITNRTMKILIVSSYDSTGNSARAEGEWLIGLKKAGVEVEVMMRGDAPYANIFRAHGIPVYDHLVRRKISLTTMRLLRRLVKERAYDILHLFNTKAITNAVIGTIGQRVVLMSYRGYTGNLYWYKPTSYLNHFNPRVRRIVCVSDAVRRQVQRQLPRNKQKAVTLYKGHNIKWYEEIIPLSRDALGWPALAFVVGIVANARPMKGIRYFIDAARYLAPYTAIHFVMIGENMDNPGYMQRIARSPLGRNFHVMGFRNDSLQIMAATNLAVLSSVRGEGLSKTIIEAMGLGLPVVATDVGGNNELVDPGHTGQLVPPRNAQALARAIHHYYINPLLRKQHGQNGRERIRRHFPLEQSVSQALALYKEMARLK